jgi:hypothetical protein
VLAAGIAGLNDAGDTDVCLLCCPVSVEAFAYPVSNSFIHSQALLVQE